MREERHQVREFDGFPVGQFLRVRPLHEMTEQRGVSLLRVLGLSAFVAQELQEIFH